MKTSSWLLLTFILFVLFSCGKHIYVLNNGELDRMATASIDPQTPAFIVYNNGDTVKGTVLKRKHNIINGKSTWLMDGKAVSIEDVSAYQDKSAYYSAGGAYTRIYHGKINLYVNQTDNSKITTYYSKSTNEVKVLKSGGTTSTFYMEKGGKFLGTSFNNVQAMVQDNPAGIAQFNKEFPPHKANRYMFQDYRAFVRILTAYDSQK